MLSHNRVKSRLLVEILPKRKDIRFLQKKLYPIIDDIDAIPYNEKKTLFLATLTEGAVLSWNWLIDRIKTEIAFGLLFLLIFVFFSAGAILYFNLDQEPSWEQSIFTVSTFLTFLCAALRFYRPIWFIVGLLLCVALGVLAAKIETWRMSTPMLDRSVSTTLTGRIVSIETTETKGFRLKLDVLKTENPTLRRNLDRVLLVARNLPVGLLPGDGVYGRVQLRALSGPVRPGSYDFSFHNYFKNIGAQGFYLGKPIKIAVPQPETVLGSIQQKIGYLRMKMTQKIYAVLGSKPESGVAAALITGERSGIPKDINEALRRSGLAHILSISGLHMALLSGMVLVFIRSFFALFPLFSSYYPVKKFSSVIALIVTAFYLLLSGSAVAAQRSFIMIAVMLTAVLCNRSALTMRNFSIAGLAIVAITPHEILNPSFQMSFSATAALISSFSWWSRRYTFCSEKVMPSYIGRGVFRSAFSSIFTTAVSSFIAGSSSGIYAAYHFSNAAPLSVISNVLVLPIVSIFVVPFGLISTLAMPLELEKIPLQIMGFGINLVIKTAHTVTNVSPVFNFGFIPESALFLLSLGLVGLTFLRTSVRFFFSIFIFWGILISFLHSPVQLVIADDMSLIGVINEKKLYIDRSRASKFIISIWEKSFRVSEIIKPTKGGISASNGPFICDSKVCRTVLENGLQVAVLRGETDQCIEADILIRTFATGYRICDESAQIILTPQLLSSRGSVMITKNKDVIWSSKGPHRPWNTHRRNVPIT